MRKLPIGLRQTWDKMEQEIKNLKEFIHEKFESHEELEALRFKRIDELHRYF